MENLYHLPKMSNNSSNIENDSEYLEDKYVEDEWTDACYRLFSSVFTIYEPWYKQFFESSYEPKLCYNPYDSLEVQILEDYIDRTFCINQKFAYINKQETQIQEILKSRLGDDLAAYFSSRPLEKFPPANACPYCTQNLHLIRHEHDYDHEGERILTGGVEYCFNCHYWRFHHLEGRYIGRWPVYAYSYMSLLSKVREFENEFPHECSAELAQWLKQNPIRWHSINPYRLEKLVADIFKANHNHAEVIHVGKPHDGGVDVLFIDTDKKQWLIQVKRRENPKTAEPVETIRNLLGTMVLQGSCYGIVVSTVDHFTYQAYHAANRAAERGMTIKLIDKGILNRMLEVVLPDVLPWLVSLMNSYIEFPSESKFE